MTHDDIQYLREWLYNALIPESIRERFYEVLDHVEQEDGDQAIG